MHGWGQWLQAWDWGGGMGTVLLSGLFSLGIATGVGRAQVPEPPQDRQYAEYRVIRDFTYLTRGDRPLKADLFLPLTEGLRPAVLLIHGGGWMSGNKNRMYFHGRYLARRGYAAMAIDYRLAPEHKHPAQIDDCREAVRWLRRHAARYDIDAQRLAAFGYSAGGHLACLLGTTSAGDVRVAAGEGGAGAAQRGGGDGGAAWQVAARPSDRVQAVIAGGAPCDLLTYPEEDRGLMFFLGHARSEAEEVYRAASPLAAVTPDDAPTFFFHGSDDALVPLENARRMADRLRAVGVRSEFVALHGRNHIGAFLCRDTAVNAVDFLDEVLSWSLPVKKIDSPAEERPAEERVAAERLAEERLSEGGRGPGQQP